jgi:NADPH-dependent curcumin reductase CurA
MPDAASFELRESPLQLPDAGEVLIRNLFLSVDPWLLPALRLLRVGITIPGDAVGHVMISRHPFFRPGDIVEGYLGWQEHAVSPWYLLRKIDPTAAPVSTALGILGWSGATAYVGTFEIGRIRAGETVIVSGSAGAVGSAAAQMAKLVGSRVIGIAGSAEKIRYLTTDLHLDAAIDYKADGWSRDLRTMCPFGVDVYFDNVGGHVSEAVARILNAHARIVVCGQIAEYGSPMPRTRMPWLAHVLEKRARVQGFLVSEFGHRLPEALRTIEMWMRAGLITYRETRAYGLENAPAAFVSMLQGRNIGKQLVEL